jgi:hypothetical protein
MGRIEEPSVPNGSIEEPGVPQLCFARSPSVPKGCIEEAGSCSRSPKKVLCVLQEEDNEQVIGSPNGDLPPLNGSNCYIRI